MSLKNICARGIFVLSAFLFFSFSCLAALSEEDERKVYTALKAQWMRVDYRQPPGFFSIFQVLHQSLWPALPESYEWRIEIDQVNLYKHELAVEHSFEFVRTRIHGLASLFRRSIE